MRTFVTLVALSSIAYATSAHMAAAQTQNVGIAGRAATGRSGEAWRFKFYRGRWWYWLPTNHWAVYENGRWLMPIEGDPPSRPNGSSPVAAPSPGVAARKMEEVSFAEAYPSGSLVAEEVRQSAAHSVSVGSAFSRAHAHAQVLEKYAASGETVPARIVKEQAAAIHHEVEQAQKSLAKLAMAEDEENKNLPASTDKKAQQGLRKIAEALRQLEVQVQHQSAVQAVLVRGQTAIISELLEQADAAARAAAEAEAKREQDLKDREGI